MKSDRTFDAAYDARRADLAAALRRSDRRLRSSLLSSDVQSANWGGAKVRVREASRIVVTEPPLMIRCFDQRPNHSKLNAGRLAVALSILSLILSLAALVIVFLKFI